MKPSLPEMNRLRCLIAAVLFMTASVECKFNCKFDMDFCSWTYNGRWKFESVGEEYEYLARLTSSSGRLISPIMTPPTHNSDACVTIQYDLINTRCKVEVFLSHVIDSNTSILYESGDVWRFGEKQITIDVKSAEDYKIQIKATKGVGVKELSLKHSSCFSNFERCEFGYYSRCNYKGNWKIMEASDHTTPKYDHTTFGDGYFASLQKKNNKRGRFHKKRKQNKKSKKFISPSYSFKDGEGCLLFWLYMTGDDSDTLKINVIGRTKFQKLSTKTITGHQGDYWNAVYIPFSTKTKKAKFVFMGNVKSKNGVIALDDITRFDRSCLQSGTCSFSTDLCSWTVTNMDVAHWELSSGQYSKETGGPTTDELKSHKNQYVYLKNAMTGNPSAMQESELLSVELKPSSASTCVKFSYFLPKSCACSLSVDVVSRKRGKLTNKKVLWMMSTQVAEDSVWTKASFPIDAYIQSGSSYFIALRGHYRTKCSNSMAIDSVLFTPDTKCSIMPVRADPNYVPRTTSTPRPTSGTTTTTTTVNLKTLSSSISEMTTTTPISTTYSSSLATRSSEARQTAESTAAVRTRKSTTVRPTKSNTTPRSTYSHLSTTGNTKAQSIASTTRSSTTIKPSTTTSCSTEVRTTKLLTTIIPTTTRLITNATTTPIQLSTTMLSTTKSSPRTSRTTQLITTTKPTTRRSPATTTTSTTTQTPVHSTTKSTVRLTTIRPAIQSSTTEAPTKSTTASTTPIRTVETSQTPTSTAQPTIATQRPTTSRKTKILSKSSRKSTMQLTSTTSEVRLSTESVKLKSTVNVQTTVKTEIKSSPSASSSTIQSSSSSSSKVNMANTDTARVANAGLAWIACPIIGCVVLVFLAVAIRKIVVGRRRTSSTEYLENTDTTHRYENPLYFEIQRTGSNSSV